MDRTCNASINDMEKKINEVIDMVNEINTKVNINKKLNSFKIGGN
jgi:hypothetical protein